ncbi:conjugal transfer protein TraF [Shewanella salipaludis]|uniref:Conjugal transfer protein TraF n=1 Tax=Shewanella salipaludis TaxID=2723052 RepID=A0A972JJ92_9GAMM|nr:conjugal transfer protein TraF [Shewanella salipaludis]NMH65888.1 conjugal transfer protein TraF [Shewanella salipaludis]
MKLKWLALACSVIYCAASYGAQGDYEALSAMAASNRFIHLHRLDPGNSPAETDLLSRGQMTAGSVPDLGLALSFPLSIVNMPVMLGLSPGLQYLDSHYYAMAGNNLEAGELDNDSYRNEDLGFNLDVGVAMELTEGLTLGVSGRNLFRRELERVDPLGRIQTYRAAPSVTAGITYDWSMLTLSSDIELTRHYEFADIDGSQYWRMGGELRATDWLSLRLGYRQDLEAKTAGRYSIGTGVSLGRVFNLDLVGMYGTDDAMGAVLQTSYHF